MVNAVVILVVVARVGAVVLVGDRLLGRGRARLRMLAVQRVASVVALLAALAPGAVRAHHVRCAT